MKLRYITVILPNQSKILWSPQLCHHDLFKKYNLISLSLVKPTKLSRKEIKVLKTLFVFKK